MENVAQGQSLMLGITIDPDGDVVLLVVIGRENEGHVDQLAVSLTPEVGASFAAALNAMSHEAHTLEEEMESLTPTEAVHRVEEIRARYSAGTN